MKIISVVGARPNFIKMAPFFKGIKQYNKIKSSGLKEKSNTIKREELPNPCANPFADSAISHVIVHTGQHYDDQMSRAFFEQLEIPEPDIYLGVGSGSHAEQVGNTMIEFEKVVKRLKPDWVVVFGDVNATLACSLTAKKEWIKCCHVEAGLRSGDMTMPEEINRIVTDRVSDLLLTPDRISVENLKKEGIPQDKIHFVGNIMIDTLESNREKASRFDINKIISKNLLDEVSSPRGRSKFYFSEIKENNYGLITLHRPSNVDNADVLGRIVRLLTEEISNELPLIWPLHPRTEKQLKVFGFWNEIINSANLILLQPLGYLEMLRLNMGARLMLTDSGGLQEECAVLGTPCLIMRWNTERPVTLKENGGTCVLVGNDIEKIRSEFRKALREPRSPHRPEFWDGKTAKRCLEAILGFRE